VLGSLSSKADKQRLDEDSHILRTLQERTADASMDGTDGYSALKEQSVNKAKEAESLAKDAVKLASAGHKDRIEASGLVEKVVKGTTGADNLHKHAVLTASDEAKEDEAIARKKRMLDASAEAQDQGVEVTGSGRLNKDDKYARDRRELEKEVFMGHKDAQHRARQAHHDKPQTAAEADYDKMEEDALQAERTKSQEERRQRAEMEQDSADEQSLAEKPKYVFVPPRLAFTHGTALAFLATRCCGPGS